MHPTRESAPGNPVFTSAVDNRFAGVKPRNSPTPPRNTPGVVLVNRPRPLSMFALRICAERLYVKPRRGLTLSVDGARFVVAANVVATAEFASGVRVNALPSTRAP